MKHVDTRWLLYGEAHIPLWLLVLALAAAIYVSWRWLNAERYRPNLAGRLLPYTWGALLIMVVWFIWQPVLVRIDNWEYNEERLVFLDRSESMSRKLCGESLTETLNALRFWLTSLPGDRNISARELTDFLEKVVAAGAKIRKEMEKFYEDMEQHVPSGDGLREMTGRYGNWAGMIRGELPQKTDAAQTAINTQAAETGGDATTNFVRAVRQLEEAMTRLPSSLNDPLEKNMPALLPVVDAFLNAAEPVISLSRPFQAALDKRYYAANENTLKPLLEKWSGKTRFDAARHILSSLKDVEVIEGKDPEETDLYGAIDQLLARQEDREVSDLIVLSDGGHNTFQTSETPARLPRMGIRLTTVGVGWPGEDIDLAILDWEVAPVISTREKAVIRVLLKTPEKMSLPFNLIVTAQDQEIHNASFVTSGLAEEQFEISFRLPKEGRQVLTLRINIKDANEENNRVTFAVTAIKGMPEIFLLGDLPDWDTEYIYLSMLRGGLKSRQLFHGYGETPLPRGRLSRAVPANLTEWSKYGAVVLKGAPFKGVLPKDVETLHQYVVEKGGTILIVAGPQEDWLQALAARFGWTGKSEPLADGSVVLNRKARYLPPVRVGVDAVQSARLIGSLGMCGKAYRVPPQQIVILENRREEPVMSLGFYGRGKVYILGLTGLYKISEFDKATLLGRLLAQVLADACTPLFPAKETGIVSYPCLMVPGYENFLISLIPDAAQVSVGAKEEAVILHDGATNRWGVYVPPTAGRYEVKAGQVKEEMLAVINPGMEQIQYEFNETFLKSLAEQAKGRYLALDEAAAELSGDRPKTWKRCTTRRYPLAEHWSLMAVIAFFGTLHWVLRKLAGLAI